QTLSRDKRSQELIEQLDTMAVQVKKLNPQSLMANSLALANENKSVWAEQVGQPLWERYTEEDPLDVLETIQLFYIETELVSYDISKLSVNRLLPSAYVKNSIKLRIYSEIAKAYPDLAKECQFRIDLHKGALRDDLPGENDSPQSYA